MLPEPEKGEGDGGNLVKVSSLKEGLVINMHMIHLRKLFVSALANLFVQKSSHF